MYRKPDGHEDFLLPFGGKLDKNNRWVKMAGMIPWDEIEQNYASLFSENIGNVAKPAQMALGALIIQQKLGLTDRETVEQIKENPYLQYFIGFKEFQKEAPFDHSLLPRLRKRFDLESMQDINEMICQVKKKDRSDDDEDPPAGSNGEPRNKGKMILDGSCAPADIRYPTDIGLLNESREKLEFIIDILHAPLKGKVKKPRTYRIKARKEYLKIAKQRQPKRKQLRKAVGKQLRFLSRNLKHIKKLLEISPAVLTVRHSAP